MENFKKIAKAAINAAAKITVAAAGVTVTSIEKVIDIVQETKQKNRMELFVAQEGYRRFVINKTTNPKFDIYEVYNSQEKIEYQIDGKLTSKNCALNFVADNQVIADVYENKSKRKKGLFNESVVYEFVLEVNDNHYGFINIGFEEGSLNFCLDTNKWKTNIGIGDRKVEIVDDLEQAVCLIDLKPRVKDMITVDVKENHNQLLALMYSFVIIAVKKYLEKS